MILYGTAALAVCMIIGQILGTFLGKLMGVDADIGGVGFAMVLLIFVTGWLRKKNLMPEPTKQGILFWASMYIPIVVGMSSIQNVAGAVDGGVMALVAGFVTVLCSAGLVPILSKIGKPSEPLPPLSSEGSEIDEVEKPKLKPLVSNSAEKN